MARADTPGESGAPNIVEHNGAPHMLMRDTNQYRGPTYLVTMLSLKGLEYSHINVN